MMTCTQCQRPAGDFNPEGLDAKSIILLANNWLCDSCLDEDEQGVDSPVIGKKFSPIG